VKRLYFVYFALLSFPIALPAQSNTEDSLKKIIQKRTFKTPKDYINTLNVYANIWHIKNLDTTIFYAQKALQIAEKEQYTEGKIEALRQLTTGYDLKGDLGEANKYLETALQLAEKLGNPELLAKVYNNCGNLYFKKDTKVGLEYFFKVLEIRKKMNDKRNISSTLLNIGSMYLRLKDYENSLKYYLESLALKKELKDTRGIGLIYGNVGNIYKEKKDFPKAKEYAFQSVAEHEKVKNESGKFYSYMMLSDIFFDEKNDEECIQYALKSHEIAQKIKAKQQMAQALKRLHLVYARRQDFQKAYEYSLAYKAISDSLLNESNIKKNTELEAKIAYQKKENSLKTEQTQKLAYQRFYTYLIGLALFFVSFLALMGYRNRQAQKKAHDKLSKQNFEIQNQAEELRQINEELDSQKHQLEDLNHTKDRLLAIIGHDLKSPINTLKGLLSLVNNQAVSPSEFISFSGKLQQNVDNVYFLLNNLLHWANAQMQGIETEPQQISLFELAEENRHLFENMAQQKQITLLNHIAPEAHAWADRDQIDLVFRNLISNALKFTPEGGTITLHTEVKSDFQHISVQDTGVGMKAEKLQTLFLPTQHASTQGTAGEKGTGLGLLVCKEFVENNAGKIWVESTISVGTTFFFSLPTAKTEVVN
jgi:signal transduction histidine kinase/tetratricopeptide (TPR) repeat protein